MRRRSGFLGLQVGLLLLIGGLFVLGPAVAEANALLNSHLKGAAYGGAGVASPWVKLHVGDPGAAGANNAATETDRTQVTFNNAANGQSVNAADLDWAAVAATETYSHYSLWTASVAGTFLGSGTVSGGSVQAGNNFKIPAGSFTINITEAA